jgi:outer membrane protein assembly factor BamB
MLSVKAHALITGCFFVSLPLRLLLPLLLLLLSDCKNGPDGGIHFVGLKNGPCGGQAGAEAGLAEDTVDAAVSPEPTILFGTVPLRIIHDGTQKLTTVHLLVDGEAVELEGPAASYALDTTKLEDGTLELAADATDVDGKKYSIKIQVCVDNEVPVLKLESPPDKATLWIEDAALSIVLSANDLTLTQVKAQLTLQGLYQERDCPLDISEGKISCELEPAIMGVKIAEGRTESGEVRVIARDAAGHEMSMKRSIDFKTRLKWKLALEGSIKWPVELLSGDAMAVPTESGKIFIVDAKTGKTTCKWEKPIIPEDSARSEIYSPLTATSTKTQLFFTSYGALWSIPATCPQPAQTAPLMKITAGKGFFGSSRPALREDGNEIVVFVGRDGGDASPGLLEAYRTKDGTQLASLSITSDNKKTIHSSPVLSADNQTLYIGTPEGSLYAFEVANAGTIQPKPKPWPITWGGNINTAPLPYDTSVYVATTTGEVYAVDLGTGEKSTTFQEGFSAGKALSAVKISPTGNLLYTGSENGTFYALEVTSSTSYEIDLGTSKYSSAAFSQDADQMTVYVATVDSAEDDKKPSGPGRVYALSEDLGYIHWYFTADSKRSFTASPVIYNGTLYIGDSKGSLYALDATAPSDN